MSSETTDDRESPAAAGSSDRPAEAGKDSSAVAGGGNPVPVRVAVVGAGPAGFYTAGHLLADKERQIEVDMFERLPTPWGLVRSGVAPDHPKIKSVTRVYEKTAKNGAFRFYGNVELGKDISRDDLLKRYHAVVYATGAPSDRSLGIPGEELAGSWPATDFVGWYNGHPDQCDLQFDLSCERAVVIGNGNVALDVARMLMLPHSELACTDTADHALEALAASRVQEVVVVGRRGPGQAAFTNPELLELADIEGVEVIVDAGELEHALATPDPTMEPTAERNVKILRDYAERTTETGQSADGGSGRSPNEEPGQAASGGPGPTTGGEPGQAASDGGRRIVLRFLLSPIEILGDEHGVKGVVLGRNELVAEGGSLRAKPTGETETIEAGLVFRAIGYRGMPLEGVPFDQDRAVIANAGGRVTDPCGSVTGIGGSKDAHPGGGRAAGSGQHEDADPGGGRRKGEYVVGWIKRGPSGVIGTNKKDAQETVNAILEDIDSSDLLEPEDADRDSIDRLLHERQPELVTYEGWGAIDRHERSRGEREGRPRVKLTKIDQMLKIAAEQTPADEPLQKLGLR